MTPVIAVATAVSGLVHESDSRRGAWLVVTGTDGGAALVPRTVENVKRAESALAAGIVAGFEPADVFYAGLGRP